MKTTGLGDDLLVAGFHIGGDIMDVAVSGGPALLDVTDITQSAHSRLGGLRDGHMALTTYFDGAAGQSHAALSTLPTADVIMSYLRGQVFGNPGACLNAKQVGYDPTRGADGSLTFKLTGEGNAFGLEWGVQLTPGVRTDTTATAGPVYTDTAQTAFGGQAYLQLAAFTGTSVTVAIQHATSSGGTYTNIIPFTSMNAIGAQRAFVSNTTTIDQFLKVTTTGTFSNAVFSVVFMRNLTSGIVF